MGISGLVGRADAVPLVRAVALSAAALVAVVLFAACPDPAAAVTQYRQVSSASNASTSCGVVVDGNVRCWGYNGEGWTPEDGPDGVMFGGSTGSSTLTSPSGASFFGSSTPVSVAGVSGATQVSVGGSHVCARLNGGSVSCWGRNHQWQLGFGPYSCKPDWTGVTPDVCFNRPYQCDCMAKPTQVPGVSGVEQVSSGVQHTCALISDGTVTCWGDNWGGQVGDGTELPLPIQYYFWNPRLPVKVVGISDATQISAGSYSCARLSSGQVKCWGGNNNGELGNGTRVDRVSTPTTVSGIWSAKQVSVGQSNACAVLDDGSVKCWGSGAMGIGTGGEVSSPDPVTVPATVPGIANARQVAVDKWAVCALLKNGTVKCWGYNFGGSVGDGTTTPRPNPVAVPGLSGVTALSEHGGCARLSTGGVRCWGDNSAGQVGDGTLISRLTPVPVYDTPTEDTDTDGDGLPDGWETAPVDLTGDGKVDLDLPAMGADPERKDLFVELDAMANLKPSQDAIDAVVNSFADSPVSNPNGETGIRLHVDNGPSSPMNTIGGERWGSLSRANGIPWKRVTGSYTGPGDDAEYDWSEFDSIKAANFDPVRARVFRYAVSVNRYGRPAESSGGIARGIKTTDFLVSVGGWCRPEGRCLPAPLVQGAMFMHELGHTLGLRHGGNDNINNKPNYLSVMNYLFNATGVLRSDLARGRGLLDYSAFGQSDLPDLDEHRLVESAGVSSSPKLANYMTVIYNYPTSFLVPASGPADFNADGDTADTVSKNINGDLDVQGNSIGSILGTLSTFADWPNLAYQAGAIGLAGTLPSLPITTDANEPSMELLMKFADLAAAPPVVKTSAASSVTQASAKLNGTVNPSGQATEVQFSYGTTTDNTRFTAFSSAGKGTATIPFSKTITGLVGDTTYTVQAVARTGTQLVYGSAVTFKTAACSKLTTRSKRQSCVLSREQFKCEPLTSPTQKATCLKNATALAGRTR